MVGALVVFTQSIFVLGLRVLGQKMSDPWGADNIDLSVIHYTIFNWRMSQRILHTRFPRHEANLDEETDLAKGRLDIGAAWEPTPEDKTESGSLDDREQSTQDKLSSTRTLDELGAEETWKHEDLE